jgi:hypothetical protein
VDLAVKAARKAFQSWRNVNPGGKPLPYCQTLLPLVFFQHRFSPKLIYFALLPLS